MLFHYVRIEKREMRIEKSKNYHCFYRKSFPFYKLKGLLNNKLTGFIIALVFIFCSDVCCFAEDKVTPLSVIRYVLGITFVVLFNAVIALIFLTPVILVIYGFFIFPILEKRRLKDYVEKNHLKYIEKISKLPNNIDVDFIKFNGSKSFKDVIIFQKEKYSYMLMDLKFTYKSSKGECGTFPLPLLIIVDKRQNFPYFYLKNTNFEKNIELRCAYSGSKRNSWEMEEEYRKRLSFYQGYNIVMEEDSEFVNKYILDVDENNIDEVKYFFDNKKRDILNELTCKYHCFEGNGNLFVICSAIELNCLKDKIKFMEDGLELYNKIIC